MVKLGLTNKVKRKRKRNICNNFFFHLTREIKNGGINLATKLVRLGGGSEINNTIIV